MSLPNYVNRLYFLSSRERVGLLPSIPGGEAFLLKVPVMPFGKAQYFFRLDFEIYFLRLLLFGEGSIEEYSVDLEGCIESEVWIE